MSRLIDADALIADCQLAQKQADRHGREFANAFYSGGGEVSTEWWCVEDMIENAPTIEQPEIIHCRECKWAKSHRLFDLEYLQCERSSLDEYYVVQVDDFCSYAERREEGEQE